MGLVKDRGWVAPVRVLVTGDDGGGVERRESVEGGDPFGAALGGRLADNMWQWL